MTDEIREIVLQPGDSIKIVVPEPRHNSMYDIILPSLADGWSYAHSQMIRADLRPPDPKMLAVTAEAPRRLREAVEQIAKFFRCEFGYDFVQYSARGHEAPHVAFVWSSREDHVPRCAIGAVYFFYYQPKGGPAFWVLNWAWFHPYERRKGYLRKAWPFFQQMFGRFCVEAPLSKGMTSFLEQVGCSDWYKLPESDAHRGDWLNVSRRILEGGVPWEYRLPEDYEGEPEEGAEGEFREHLLKQRFRNDPIGDLGREAMQDPSWPKGGVRDVWRYLQRRGAIGNWGACLLDAWSEYLDGPALLPESFHRSLGPFLRHVRSELMDEQMTLQKLASSHPTLQPLRDVCERVERYQGEMSSLAEEEGVEEDYYYPGPKPGPAPE